MEENDEDNIPIKLMPLLQIMYYNIHHSEKKTPLHVIDSHAIYVTSKGRDLITSFKQKNIF